MSLEISIRVQIQICRFLVEIQSSSFSYKVRKSILRSFAIFADDSFMEVQKR